MHRSQRYWLMPSILILILFSVMVLGYSVYLSLHNISMIKQTFSFVGLSNLFDLFQDKRAWASVGKTLQFSFIATFAELALGLAIALYFNRQFPGRKLVRALMLIPMIMTPVVSGLIWRIFYDPNAGIVNYYLGVLGLGNKHDWLGSVDLAMFSVIIADVWQWTPFVFLIMASALDAMPGEPLEAAKVDGANAWQTFRSVVLPLLKPALMVALLLRLMDSIKTFDIIYVMTRGGPSLATETANMYAYIQGFNNFNLSYATVINLSITVLLTFVFTFLYKSMTAKTRG
ncbi:MULTISPECIES: carbohydrate ABC transporter permease [unclassified Paenibacillus]|uniref:carbohydrate ABC transporter permease n=1 Tax=unclassified Paenibacillus TaxID=185978 RepID=UPI001C10820F|nr:MULTISPECIES: sugar ABC transporter permease [unclassified Paenibacillus]MBU5445441.1 sugar ABC transporter permease [Paenibacillus sp. MSJ-34]CAH0119312.1 Trehalose transport system permease protein SugA [Paenibacillus sp. CECT 9249]